MNDSLKDRLKVTSEVLTLPAWIAPVLVNGDDCGLDFEDEETLKHLEEYLLENELGLCISVSESLEFYNSAPIDSLLATGSRLGGDFLDYTFEKLNK